MSRIIWVDTATSTNNALAAIPDAEHGTALAAHTQTAGRGQRGNLWESEPGKNLTFSLLLRPTTITAVRQFELSQLVCMAVARALGRELGQPERVRVKWPNDIYYDDLKLVGILIENTLQGSDISRSIAGIGINVNQREFLSDAPNPVSMWQIAGHEYLLEDLLQRVVDEIVSSFDAYESHPDSETLTREYMTKLWRGEGFWPYRDASTGERFNARIASVGPMGHLTLTTAAGQPRTYAFKEVTPITS